VPGTFKLVGLNAGPASDNREFGAGFFAVDGSGIPDLAFPRGSGGGCITDRLLESISSASKS